MSFYEEETEESMDNIIVRLLGGLILGILILAVVIWHWRSVTHPIRPRLYVVRTTVQSPRQRAQLPLTTEQMSVFAATFDEKEYAVVFRDLNRLVTVYFPHLMEEKKETERRLKEIAKRIKRQERKRTKTESQFAQKLYRTHQRLGVACEQYAEDLETIEGIAGSIKNNTHAAYTKSAHFDIRHQISTTLRRLDKKHSLATRQTGGNTEGESG